MNKHDVNDYSFGPLPLCCCYTILWNSELLAWPFTTMNSYWVEHASA